MDKKKKPVDKVKILNNVTENKYMNPINIYWNSYGAGWELP